MPDWMPKSAVEVWKPKSATPVDESKSDIYLSISNMPRVDRVDVNTTVPDDNPAGGWINGIWHPNNKVNELNRNDNALFGINTEGINNWIADKASRLPSWLQKPAAFTGSALANVTSSAAEAALSAPEGPALGLAGLAKAGYNKAAIEAARPKSPYNPDLAKALNPERKLLTEGLSQPQSTPSPRFYSGRAGLGDTQSSYKVDTAQPGIAGDITRVNPPVLDEVGNVLPTPGGTILPQDIGSVNEIPAMQAAETGLGGQIKSLSGHPPTFHPPENLDQGLQQIKDITQRGVDVPRVSDLSTVKRITGDVGVEYKSNPAGTDFQVGELPKPNARKYGLTTKESEAFNRGDWKPKSAEPISEPSTLATPKAEIPSTKPLTPETPTNVVNNKWYRKISDTASPKESVKQWAQGRNGAKVRGIIEKEKFADLDDPSLIDKYEAGDRSGRLADVAKYFDTRQAEGEAAGILKQDQKVLNYLRHEFEQPAAEVTEKLNSHIAKTPSIAKTRRFPSYAVAEEAGLTRKFKTLPDIIEAYETKFHQAIRNKELYDHLAKTKQLSPGTTLSTNMNDWAFNGPNAGKLKKYISNAMSQSPDWLKKIADTVSLTKNMYLGGGLPGTKLNMHAYNIARSDYKLEGLAPAAKELFSDPTGKKALEVFNTHKDLLPELVERGYVFHPEDTGKGINPLLDFQSGNKTLDAIGKGASKVISKSQDLFERALFDRALPALKLKRAAEVVDKLTPSLGREKALSEAAKISNDFYGGVDKSIRGSVGKDLNRIIFLAPDWLESRIRLAARDYAGSAKFLVGKGNEVSNIGAKSAARGIGLGGITLGGKLALDKFNSKPGDVLDFPVGDVDSKGKDRDIQVFGTSDEGVRVPIQTAMKVYQGDPAPLVDLLIKNRLSLPLKSTMNIVQGRDDLGRPLKGGNISGDKAILNYLNEMSKPMQFQAIQGLLKYANGEASLEEALSTAAELPIKYSRQPSQGGFSISMPK